MPDALPQVALVAVLILINAVLAGGEVALISLREPQLNRLAEHGRRGIVAAELARDPNRYLATVQIGITLAGFMASAVAAVSLAEPITHWFTIFGSAADTVAIVVVTLALSFVTLVLGELAPKRLALQHPEGWALALGMPLHWLSVVTKPIVWILGVATDAVVRLFGGSPDVTRDRVTLDELRELVSAGGVLTDDQAEVLRGAIDVAERTVRDVMTPRTEVVYLPADRTVEQAAHDLIAAGFSRAPVVEPGAGLDHAIGLVTFRDLAGAHDGTAIRDIASEAISLPESMEALDALRTLQAERRAMGFVVDEHGGIEGIITVEDLVEELVGEIYDESDRDQAEATPVGGGAFSVPGRLPAHALEDLGVDVPDGDFSTAAGLVLDMLGRLPEPGEFVDLGTWRATVVSVEDNAITEIRFDVQ